MHRRLRIVVSGLAASYPVAGMFWHYMQYVAGLSRLGHELLYVEDTERWCYDPAERTFVERGEASAAYLSQNIRRVAPEALWFFRDAAGQTFGVPWRRVTEFIRDADLVLNISGFCSRDEYFHARRLAYIDTDPMFAQASVPEFIAGTVDDKNRTRMEKMLQHDVFFTFAENIGATDCLVPNQLFEWCPTRQPIVRELFDPFVRPVAARRRVVTTVGSWGSATETGLRVAGVRYGGKKAEFQKFFTLPAKSPLPLELSIGDHESVEALKEHGWLIRDNHESSSSPWVYCHYLADSWAEWSPAKNAYVASNSGWFSERSACYLALGVPVVVQDTGFSRYIETGEGVIAFTSIEEAIDGLHRISSKPERHARAALDVVAEYFDHTKVLSHLLEKSFSTSESLSRF
jgi:hypothetical protein